jgi:hypothetical protein
MKLLMESWRKFLKEDTRAFHGYGMDPVKMRVPACSKGEDPANPNNQWESEKEEGCPKFTDDKDIGADHEDAQEAIAFIENVKPEKLIAYSRGGAVASMALNQTQHKPEVVFVAPAWKRGWVAKNPLPPSGLQGAIVHGTRDNAVPLRHSFELAKETGMPLYVAPEKNHISILKFKDNPEKAIQVSPKIFGRALKHLPEWESGLGSKEQVEAQHQFVEKLRQK